jgi:hypothetical protein
MPGTDGCFVAVGNASIGFPGLFPSQPSTGTTPALTLSAAGPTTTTSAAATYTFTYATQSAGTVPNPLLTYTLPAGVSFVSASNGGTLSGSVVSWSLGSLAAGATGTRTVTVNLGSFGGTTTHWGTVSWLSGSRRFTAVSNVVSTLYSAMLVAAWTFTEPQLRTTDGLAVANLTMPPAASCWSSRPRAWLRGPAERLCCAPTPAPS